MDQLQIKKIDQTLFKFSDKYCTIYIVHVLSGQANCHLQVKCWVRSSRPEGQVEANS